MVLQTPSQAFIVIRKPHYVAFITRNIACQVQSVFRTNKVITVAYVRVELASHFLK